MLTLVQPNTASPKTPHADYTAYLRRGTLTWIAFGDGLAAARGVSLDDLMGPEHVETARPVLAELQDEGMTPRRALAELDGRRLTLVRVASERNQRTSGECPRFLPRP